VLAHQSFEVLPGSLINGYDVVVCGACGFGFASGLPDADEFADYYARMSRYEPGATAYFTSPVDRARCESIVDLVNPTLDSRGVSVLDIGCSTGALLAAFKARGYTRVEGLDPSPACAAFASEAYGIEVRIGSTADMSRLPGGYGLVTFSHVLEHLLDPLDALRDAWQLLSEDGRVFVEVPDLEGFAGCARAPFQEFSIEHINYFSSVSLASLAGVAGLEPLFVARRQVPWLSDAPYPVVDAVFRKAPRTASALQDSVSEASLRSYIAKSERIEADVRARIRELADRGRPVLVWGIGTHTRHLLERGALAGLRVVAFVDSDPKYQGIDMRGVPVLAPTDVAKRDEPILVSSGTVHHEIARQIREELGVGNEIVLLYD
jgi:SAM-dependent methyltransferase